MRYRKQLVAAVMLAAVLALGAGTVAAQSGERPVRVAATGDGVGQIALRWDHSGVGVASFTVTRQEPHYYWDGISPDRRTFVDTRVQPDTTYRYFVCAVYADRSIACSDGWAEGRAAAAQHPAQSLVGQSVTACKGALRGHFDVVQAEWRQTVVDRPARGGAMWAVAVADVTNLGPFTDGLQGLAKVRDDRGREFVWRLFNGPDIYVEDGIAAEFGLRPSWDAFVPGITERTVLIFEVAGDARSLELLPNNLACAG
jgi:hypothetical protein